MQQTPKPLDIVFCLDLSGSTNGLINDMREDLWLIVNQAKAMKPEPNLRIGVVGFSRPSFGKNTGYVKVLADLTNNFDHLVAELYLLKPSIEKGDQYVSIAINTAINSISWSKAPNATKMIFLAGNGMVSADGIQYVKSAEEAAKKEIIINTLYIPNVGNLAKELTGWRRIATITKGMQTELTVNKSKVDQVWLDANFERIREINNRLNESYMWSDRVNSICKKECSTADSGAFFANKDVFFNRIFYKISDNYPVSLSACEATYNYLKPVQNDTKSFQANNSQNSEFENRMKSIREGRSKLINELTKELPPENLIELHNIYTKTGFNDLNIFSRCVLSILFHEWK